MKAFGIRQCALVASDTQKMTSFYRDRLGMQICADFKEHTPHLESITSAPGAEIWTVNLQPPGGGVVQLQQHLSHPQAPAVGKRCCDTSPNHLYIKIDDIDEANRTLHRDAMRFTNPSVLSSQGIAKTTCS